VDLSIIVNLYNMGREAPRTLHSLSRAYQRGVEQVEYEVMVVDNGSRQPVGEELLRELRRMGPRFEYRYTPPGEARQSPAAAINEGARRTSGQWVAVMIDGARMASPGLVHHAMAATRLGEKPVILTHGFHLGAEPQFRSVPKGYDQAAEDRLLEQIGWMRDGYRLFEIACFSGASRRGWFCLPAESNCLVMSRERFEELEGMDERFESPGGGLANLDLCQRACTLEGATVVLLLGEGTFHQYHGGVTTNVSTEENERLWQQFSAEYQRIRGRAFQRPRIVPRLFGHLPATCGGTLGPSVEGLINDVRSGG
jgi:glycosyltransferase involved in cell wall biosynthesis